MEHFVKGKKSRQVMPAENVTLKQSTSLDIIHLHTFSKCILILKETTRTSEARPQCSRFE